MFPKLILVLASLHLAECNGWWNGLPLIDTAYRIGEGLHGANVRTFRLRNDMHHNVVIQCSEKGNSYEKVALKPGAFYTINFRPHVRTLWWCNVKPWINSDENTHFNVHHGHENSHTYYLTYGGIQKMDLNGSHFHFFKKWFGHD